MAKIILIGGGGHAISCADVINSSKKFSIAGIVLRDKKDLQKSDLKILGYESDLKNLRKKYKYAVVAIGQIKDHKKRYDIYKKLKKYKFILPVIKSKFSYVSPKAKILEGTIVMHGAIVNSKASIGKNCILNTGCIIEHGAKIGSYTHISTGVIVNGDAVVKEKNFIGSGSVLHQGIKINKHRIIPSLSRIKKNI
tara:strand:- start:2 stop:586 length:585 start_codon:yes stop_codon:yes gene_type:complete